MGVRSRAHNAFGISRAAIAVRLRSQMERMLGTPTLNPSPQGGGKSSAPVVIAACALLAGASIAQAEDETVGIWIKNTSPAPVVVTVDGATACTLSAPVFGPCHDPLNKESKTCTTNNFAISCVTSVKASGADIKLTRGDGVAYKLRASKGINMYLCVEARNLTDCFGKKLQ